MSVCWCVCVCTCVCVCYVIARSCVYMCIIMCVCVSVCFYMFACDKACSCVCFCKCARICVFSRMHVCLQLCVYVCVYARLLARERYPTMLQFMRENLSVFTSTTFHCSPFEEICTWLYVMTSFLGEGGGQTPGHSLWIINCLSLELSLRPPLVAAAGGYVCRITVIISVFVAPRPAI